MPTLTLAPLVDSLLGVLHCVLLGALVSAAPAGDTAPPPAPAPLEHVAFAELAAAPERWLGETVETTVQLRGAVAAAWHGFLSGVNPWTHVALDVWADEQLLWDAAEFAAPAGRLHVPVPVLLTAAVRSLGRPVGAPATWAPHTRLRATVRVEAYTAGRGWLVLLAATPTAEQVPEGTVLHAIRGRELLAEQAFALAVSELEKALLPPLPALQRAALEADLAEARLSAGARRGPGSAPARRSPRGARAPRGSGASGPRG